MKQEDKDLLLRDLCARLPYGVKVKTPYNDAVLIGIIKRKAFSKGMEYVDAITDKQTYPLRYIQPYLRPMSSMTEEEIRALGARVKINPAEGLDYLNAHHFDYRGLISKGLALEAPEGMYNKK